MVPGSPGGAKKISKKLMFQAEDEDLEKLDETKTEIQDYITTNLVKTDDFDTKFDHLLKAKQKEPQKIFEKMSEPQKELKFNLP